MSRMQRMESGGGAAESVRLAARAAPPPPGRLLRTYARLAAAVGAAAPLLLAVRERHGKELRARRGERLGVASAPRPDGPLLWVHAASVGETNAVLPLIAALRKQRPGLEILLTTVTVTSAGLAAARLGPGARHQFLPLDTPAFARAFLDHWRPDAVVLAESEVWPCFVMEIAARRLPLALVNARLSQRSFRRWSRLPGASRALFGAFDVVLAQNDRFARQFTALGATNAVAVGNLKIDAPPPPLDPEELNRLRRAIGARPVFLAASTHEGEDEAVAEAHLAARRAHPELLTVVAPRHPSRAGAVAEAMRSRGLTAVLRSRGQAPDRSCDIYIADTIGELGLFYAVAPIAFVGGSLAAHGGQNPFEAIKLGAAVVVGPHHHNFADAYRALQASEACVQVGSAEELSRAVPRLLGDEEARRRMLGQALAVVEDLSGALRRTLDAIAPLLPAADRPARPARTQRAS